MIVCFERIDTFLSFPFLFLFITIIKEFPKHYLLQSSHNKHSKNHVPVSLNKSRNCYPCYTAGYSCVSSSETEQSSSNPQAQLFASPRDGSSWSAVCKDPLRMSRWLTSRHHWVACSWLRLTSRSWRGRLAAGILGSLGPWRRWLMILGCWPLLSGTSSPAAAEDRLKERDSCLKNLR